MERSLGIDLNADEEARRHVLTHSTVITPSSGARTTMITGYGVGQYRSRSATPSTTSSGGDRHTWKDDHSPILELVQTWLKLKLFAPGSAALDRTQLRIFP
ncbi:MAG: hypothetical protein U0703_08775 [Anaerolineae bacterium]